MREAAEYEFGAVSTALGNAAVGRAAVGRAAVGRAAVGGTAVGSAIIGLVMADGNVRSRVERRTPRPSVSAPRPAVVPVGVRPAQADRPVSRFPAHRSGPRVLVRCAVPFPPVVALRFRIRRVVAGLLAVLVTAAIVVGLGLLADASSAARAPESPGAAASVVVERIVTADSPTSVRSGSGQEPRVATG